MGFTLIELMVAIAIFAVLSALGWKIFDYVVKVKARNVTHEQQLAALQKSYQQILKDSLQIIPINATVDGEVLPALSLQQNLLQLSKTGVSDPLQQGLAPDERIEYRYVAEEQVVYRVKYPNVNRRANTDAQRSILLENVEQFKVDVLNPMPESLWPQSAVDSQDLSQLQQLPKGLQLSLTVNGQDYVWLFRLLPQQKSLLGEAS